MKKKTEKMTNITRIFKSCPSNVSTYSNLAYLYPAIQASHPLAMGAYIVLMISSGGFHLCKDNPYVSGKIQYAWQKADEISMYFVFTTLFFTLLFEGWHVYAFAIPITAYMGFYHKEWESFRAIPIMFFFVWGLKIRVIGFDWVYGFIILGFFALAGLFSAIGWNLEEIKDECHGIWHVLTSVGFRLLQ